MKDRYERIEDVLLEIVHFAATLIPPLVCVIIALDNTEWATFILLLIIYFDRQ